MRTHHRTTVEEIMTTAVIALHANDTVGDAREQISGEQATLGVGRAE